MNAGSRLSASGRRSGPDGKRAASLGVDLCYVEFIKILPFHATGCHEQIAAPENAETSPRLSLSVIWIILGKPIYI